MNTFDSETASLAAQYNLDRTGIQHSCFAKKDQAGTFVETYLIHVRIIEDTQYPYSRPPSTQNEHAKKHRILIVSVRQSGRVRIHKGRQNPNGTFQIGKTWNLEDLSKVQNDTTVATGFALELGKNYYWCTRTAREKNVFLSSVVKIFKKYTGGKVPKLVGLENITPPASPSSPTANVNSFGHHRKISSSEKLSPTPNANDRHRKTSSTQQLSPQPPPPRQNHLKPVKQPSPEHNQVKPPSPGQKLQPPLDQNQVKPPSPRQNQQLHFAQNHVKPHPPPPRQKGLRKDSCSQTPNHEIFNIPPKSAARPAQLRRAESQPKLKSRLSGSLFSGAVASLGQAGERASVGSNAAASKSAGNLLSSFENKELHSQFKIPERAPARNMAQVGTLDSFQNDSVQESSSNNTLVVVPKLPIDSQPPIPAQPSLPAITLNDSLPISSHNESLAGPVEKPFIDTKQIDISKDATSNTTKRSSFQRSAFAGARVSRNLDKKPILLHASEPEKGQTVSQPPEPDIPVIQPSKPTPTVPHVTRFERPVSYTLESDKCVSQPLESGKPVSQTFISTTQPTTTKSSESSFNTPSTSVIEETLQQLNWNGRSDIKALELSISDQLNLLEIERLHNILDLDNKLGQLDESLDLATRECERLDAMFAFFSVQLGSFSDNISLIESQGQGLQVQTRNQKMLWTELNSILHTVSLPSNVLNVLETTQLRSAKDVASVEPVLSDLYNAVNVVRLSEDSGQSVANMKALKEKKDIYEQTALSFAAKVQNVVETRVTTALRNVEDQIVSQDGPDPNIVTIEESIYKTLLIISAIILFVKEINKPNYYTILRNYETQVKQYYDPCTIAYFARWKQTIGTTADANNIFLAFSENNVPTGMTNTVKSSLKRSQTLAKIKSHTTEFRDRNNSVSATSLGTRADTINTSLILSPTNVRSSIVKAVRAIRSIIVKQQDILIKVFHQSSFGCSIYPEYVKKYTISQRRASRQLVEKVYNIDGDRAKTQELLNIMTAMFGPVLDHLVRFTADVLEKSAIDCMGVITALDIILKELQPTNLDFMTLLVQRLHDKSLMIWNHFVADQVDKIEQTYINSKKRTGQITAVRVFPMFCQRIEQDMLQEANSYGGADCLPVRALANDSYTKIGKAIISRLQKAKQDTKSQPLYNAQEKSEITAAYEDKEMMNCHVLMIENTNLFCEGLEPFNAVNPALNSIHRAALSFYEKELALYVNFILHRPFGKLMEFFENVEQVLCKNPNDDPSCKPGLGRAGLKKVLANYDSKELSKSVAALYKRVDKHFTDELVYASGNAKTGKDQKLITKVWAQTETQFLEFVRRFRSCIDKYYGPVNESGYLCKIDFTDDDIMDLFKVHY